MRVYSTGIAIRFYANQFCSMAAVVIEESIAIATAEHTTYHTQYEHMQSSSLECTSE
jgi:hypothetical protein